jgi:hypothetical protein
MLRVIAYRLSQDLRRAGTDFQEYDLGSLSPEQLSHLLEVFRHLDPVQNLEAEPYLSVSAPAGRFSLRTEGGRILLADEINTSLGSNEVAIPILLEILTRQPTGAPFLVQSDPVLEGMEGRKTRPMHQIIAGVMLLLGLGLNGYTVYSAFYVDDINLSPPLTLVTDPRAAAEKRDALAGSYATGSMAGDRIILISADGTLRLQEIGSKGGIRRETLHKFSIGTRDQKLYLGLKPRGQIEVGNRDTLVLYGDSYRRTQ